MEPLTFLDGAWKACRGALAPLRPEEMDALAGGLDESQHAGGTEVVAPVLASDRTTSQVGKPT